MQPFEIPHFAPHPLLANGHLQTVFGVYASAPLPPYCAVPHIVTLADGDQLVLHDDCPSAWRHGDRVAVLVHGVGGSHASPYVARMALKLNAQGIRTFRMDQRGCGAGYELAQLPGHAGRSEDVAAALQRVSSCCPTSAVTLIGYSMGGNIVLKLLGELGSSHPARLDSAVAVAPSIDLQCCSDVLNVGINRIYSRAFLRSLLDQVRRRRRHVPALRRISTRPRPKFLFQFDDRFTAPLSGYVDSRQYYTRCSAKPLLRYIQVPTLILTAEDDPVVPVRMFADAQFSASTRLHIARCGGHVGFVGIAGMDPDRRWLDWRLLDWVLWHQSRRFRQLSPSQGPASAPGG